MKELKRVFNTGSSKWICIQIMNLIEEIILLHEKYISKTDVEQRTTRNVTEFTAGGGLLDVKQVGSLID